MTNDRSQVKIRVKGMLQKGGFTGSGCPDAVRAEMIHLPGLMAINYQAEDDFFVITYRQDKVKIADMFSAIWMAGQKQGREFLPEVLE